MQYFVPALVFSAAVGAAIPSGAEETKAGSQVDKEWSPVYISIAEEFGKVQDEAISLSAIVSRQLLADAAAQESGLEETGIFMMDAQAATENMQQSCIPLMQIPNDELPGSFNFAVMRGVHTISCMASLGGTLDPQLFSDPPEGAFYDTARETLDTLVQRRESLVGVLQMTAP
jgi:hypothetical protein